MSSSAFFVLLSREVTRTLKQPSRLMGIIVQPLIFWAIMSSGFVSSFRMPQNDTLHYGEFFFPGMLAMVILFSTIFNTITLIDDRNCGFMQSVLVSPSTRFSMVAGKIAGVAIISLAQALLLLLLAPLSGVSFGAFNWLYGALALLFGVFGLAGAGFILAWLSPSTAVYHAFMSALLMPLWVISGAVFPVQGTWLQYLVAVNPLAWLVASLRAFFNHAEIPSGVLPLWLNSQTALFLLFVFAFVSLSGSLLVCRRKIL